MQLKEKTIQEIKAIVMRDYGVALDDSQANEFAMCLLRLTRLSRAAFARTGERISSVQARGTRPLESNTSE
jgi:hypothetical protein